MLVRGGVGSGWVVGKVGGGFGWCADDGMGG